MLAVSFGMGFLVNFVGSIEITQGELSAYLNKISIGGFWLYLSQVWRN